MPLGLQGPGGASCCVPGGVSIALGSKGDCILGNWEERGWLKNLKRRVECVFPFQQHVFSEHMQSTYISLESIFWDLGEGWVWVMWKVFSVKTSCLIVLKIRTKVLNYAKLEGCERRVDGLAVAKAMEKPGGHIIHCLEFVPHSHMQLQILSVTVILPGNDKCLDHSRCGDQR